MSLTQEQVLHLAKLSRLALSPEELELFSLQLSSVLNYVGQLQKVNTGSLAAGHITGLENVMRNDSARKLASHEAKKLVSAAPGQEENFIKTRAVFE